MVDVADAQLFSVKNKALSVHAMNVSLFPFLLSFPFLTCCLFTRKGEKKKWMREQKERGKGRKEREGEKKRRDREGGMRMWKKVEAGFSGPLTLNYSSSLSLLSVSSLSLFLISLPLSLHTVLRLSKKRGREKDFVSMTLDLQGRKKQDDDSSLQLRTKGEREL